MADMADVTDMADVADVAPLPLPPLCRKGGRAMPLNLRRLIASLLPSSDGKTQRIGPDLPVFTSFFSCNLNAYYFPDKTFPSHKLLFVAFPFRFVLFYNVLFFYASPSRLFFVF